MWTNWQFWKDSTWRAFRTFCQTLAAQLAGQSVNAISASWTAMLGVAGVASLMSLLMSVDREKAVGITEPPAAVSEPIAPAEANYIPPAALVSGCGGDLR